MKKYFLIILLITISIACLNARDKSFAQYYDYESSTDYHGYSQTSSSQSSLYKGRLSEGIQFLQENNFESAINSFWEAIQIFPNKPDAYINMATVYLSQNNPETALRFLMKAKDLMPPYHSNEETLLYNIGLCSYMLGSYPDAIIYYSQALEISPYFGEAAYALGLSYLKTGQKEKALMNITKARAIFSKNGQLDFVDKANDLLANLEKTYDQPTVSSIPEKTAEQSMDPIPNDAQAYYKKGIEYARQGHYNTAIDYFQKSLNLDPTFAKAYTNLGSTYGQLQRYSDALSAYKKAVKYDSYNPKIYYNIAMVYMATGQENEALNYLKKAKSLCVSETDKDILEKIDKWL